MQLLEPRLNQPDTPETCDAPRPITEESIYRGFHPILRPALRSWKEWIVEFTDCAATSAAIGDLRERARRDNVVIFFDHHYPFDALPASLAVAKKVDTLRAAVLPYAVHLDMGVDPEGEPSRRYRVRTAGFHWFMRHVQDVNPTIQALNVARAFEMENPKLRAIAEERFAGINKRYLRTLLDAFDRYSSGLACVLSPMGGIAFPDRPALARTIYRILDRIQAKRDEPLPCYLIGAYPRFVAARHYFAPLLAKHRFVAAGPFALPHGDYAEANALIRDRLTALREAGDFHTPDYERLKRK